MADKSEDKRVTGNGGVLYLKVSLSRTSEKGARRNIDEEIPGWDFDGVLKANQDKWRDILGRVKAKGEPHKIKNFYTAIYHLCFQPNLISDVGEDDLYSTFSCWDTFRAAGPLYTILTPEYVPAFINSMLWHFDKSGFLPKWMLWDGDNQCMNGDHSVPMIVDAYFKGVKGVDWERAYECVKASLREDRGRCDAEYEMLDKYGYFPCDFMEEESVSRLLESCYDDACAARFAAALGGLQENWDGKKRVIGDRMSCTHQTWSATAYLSLIYYHVLGADIREGEVVFKPYLPEGVNEIAVKDFKVGETTFDIVVVRGGDGPEEVTCKATKNKRVKLFLSL